MKTCLFCYQPLLQEELDFHGACAKKMFGQRLAPVLPYSEEDLEHLAKEIIQSQTAVTGVQAKLSLHLNRTPKGGLEKRFTIVGLWGEYILKLPTQRYPQLPEVEDLTMHLAQLANIKTAVHSLIRLQSGELTYLTKRMDRIKGGKLAMEDMCQLTERLTEHKYHGSYEQIGKAIQRYSSAPGLDLVNFFEVVLFSFLTGNADMHLKNFSLLEQPGFGMRLSPAYDLLNTALVNPADPEELAMSLNGRKKKLKKLDFVAAMNTLQVVEKQQAAIFNKMLKSVPKWLELIDQSFMSSEFKEQYKFILLNRVARIQ